jgi:Gpi18-like mannosyltransferase
MMGDMNLWYSWSRALDTWDWRRFYADSGTDYLPGYLYVLWALGKFQLASDQLPALVRAWVPTGDLLYKLPAITADTATVAVIYLVGHRWGHPRTAYLASFSYAVNPGIIFDSSRRGQVESVPAFFLLAALVLLIESHPTLCGVTLALSIVCKPTALVLAPLFVVALIARRRFRDVLYLGLAGIVTVSVVFFPFIPPHTNPISFIQHCFMVTSSKYPYLSVNAFNLWMLVQGGPRLLFDGNLLAGINSNVVGWLLLGGCTIPACIALAVSIHRPDPAARVILPAAAILLTAFFVVLTRMHERHLLPALPVLALTCVFWPRYWLPYCWLSGAYFLNLRYVFYSFLPYRQLNLAQVDIQIIAFLNVTTLGVMFVLLVYLVRRARLEYAAHIPAHLTRLEGA